MIKQPLAGKRIGLLTASASRFGGGVFEAVVRQAAMIRSLGGKPVIFALEDAHSVEDAARFAPSAVNVFPVFGPRQIGFTPDLVPALVKADLDMLHLHGIWMYPSRAGSVWARRTGRPYAISPHGMLDPWITRRGRLKKAIARLGYERTSWRRAAAFHALTGKETKDIARETGRDDIRVIANPAPPLTLTLDGSIGFKVVYIGRIHAKKNLEALVEAWVAASLPEDARLVIAGWGTPADVGRLQRAVSAAGPQVQFVGAKYGSEKADLLRSARFTILPSFSEGLPMAVIEGWAAGVPAIITTHCNLPAGTAAGAALPCETDTASIAATLEQAAALDTSAWHLMSQAAQALAGGEFSEASVAAQWAAFYRDAMATESSLHE